MRPRPEDIPDQDRRNMQRGQNLQHHGYGAALVQTPYLDSRSGQRTAAAIYERTVLEAYTTASRAALAHLKLNLLDDLEQRADEQLVARCMARQMAAQMCDEFTRWQLAQNQVAANRRAQRTIDRFADPFGLG